MNAVQGGARGRGDPGRIRPGAWMGYLLDQHCCHFIGHGPHSLADLGVARQSAGEADVYVPVFVSIDPGLSFHLRLADHRAGQHARVNLVARPVEEAGVDKHDPVFNLADALLEVDRRAALLVHDAHLQGVERQAQRIFDAGEQLTGEGDFLGSVHLGLDDVDATGARVAELAVALEVLHRSQ